VLQSVQNRHDENTIYCLTECKNIKIAGVPRHYLLVSELPPAAILELQAGEVSSLLCSFRNIWGLGWVDLIRAQTSKKWGHLELNVLHTVQWFNVLVIMFYLPTYFFHNVLVLARRVSATIWSSSVIIVALNGYKITTLTT
jgi:hypothetical protein